MMAERMASAAVWSGAPERGESARNALLSYY
jgi:hypothetical protein